MASLFACVLICTVVLPFVVGSAVDRRTPSPLKVAIVGAGAGGTSSAYFLQQQAKAAGRSVDISIFERRDYVGGRSTTFYPFDDERYQPVEAGASVFIAANLNLQKAVKLFKLSAGPFGGDGGSGEAIWNGREVVFQDTAGSAGHGTSLVERYGAISLTKVGDLTDAAVQGFLRVYNQSVVAAGPYTTVGSFVNAVSADFRQIAASTATDYFQANGANSLTINELVETATRVNYGQDVDRIHGIGALVSLAAYNVSSVRGGNWQIFGSFAKASGARVLLNTEVTDIRATKGQKTQYTVSHRSAGRLTKEAFDAVMIAAPFGQTGLAADTQLAQAVPSQPYVQLYVTCVATNASSPASAPFNIKSQTSLPRTVYSTFVEGNPKPRFNSLAYLLNLGERQGVVGDVHVVKLFSEAPLPSDYLAELFGGRPNVLWTKLLQWDAYPYLTPVRDPSTNYAPFRLSPGVYYPNGFERFVSTMETTTVSAWNAVSLLSKDFWDYHVSRSWADWRDV